MSIQNAGLSTGNHGKTKAAKVSMEKEAAMIHDHLGHGSSLLA